MTMVSFPGSHRNPPSTSATASQQPPPSSLPLPLPAHLTTLPVRLRQRTDIVPQQTSAQTCRNRTACMREHMVQVLPSPHTHTLSYLPRTLDDLHRTTPHQTNPDPPFYVRHTHTHTHHLQCNAVSPTGISSTWTKDASLRTNHHHRYGAAVLKSRLGLCSADWL